MLHYDKRYVYIVDKMRMTGLHWAAMRNNVKIMETLLAFGAHVNMTDMS